MIITISFIISILTILTMILSILFFNKVKIFNHIIQPYWLIVLFGAILLIVFGNVTSKDIISILSSSSINPVQIVVLFISMSLLSIFLDKTGFFKYAAYEVTKKAHSKQIYLFLLFSILVSFLTVFTSNDIVILTFTPFICYYCYHTRISPIPYLVSEYILANTWSMLFVIGNPTNIFIASTFHIDFIVYLKNMFLPTIIAGIFASITIFLLFKKNLKEDIVIDDDNVPTVNKPLMIIGLCILSICTILLVISSYIDIEMWLISFISAVLLVSITFIYDLIKKENYTLKTISSCPWNLIPFVLSMFIIIFSIDKSGYLPCISNLLDSFINNKINAVFGYGLTSFISANLVNNIPMSIMFSNIIEESNGLFLNEKIYSTIISSNIGAYLTPIGALAGIMWMSILEDQGVKFKFIDFVKKVSIISIIVLFVCLSTYLIF